MRRGFTGSGLHTVTEDGRDLAQLYIELDLAAAEPNLKISGWAFGRRVEQTIPLVSKVQPLGGERWFARCPLTGKRCLTLLLLPGARTFGSVAGWRLAYPSQREARVFRLYRAKEKIERKLDKLSKYTRHKTIAALEQRVARLRRLIADEEEAFVVRLR
jgi:hypothetical protein